MICNRCGQTNRADSRFCTSCGYPLEPASGDFPVPGPRQKISAPVVILSMACVLFTIVALLLLFGVIRPGVPAPVAASVPPAAIDGSESPVVIGEDAPVVVCLLIADGSAAWYASQADDISTSLEEAGYMLAVGDAGGDAEAQMIQLEDAVVTGADVIVLEPVLAEACIPALEVARESGISVVLLGRSSALQGLSDTSIDKGAMVTRRLIDWLHEHW